MPEWWPIYWAIGCCLFLPMVIVMYVLSEKVTDYLAELTGWR